MFSQVFRRWLALGLCLAGPGCGTAQQAAGATFGDVIQLQGGTPSDIVLDELRHQLYLVSNTTSRVNIFDYTTNQVVGSIPVGKSPLAGAMSMDGELSVRHQRRHSDADRQRHTAPQRDRSFQNRLVQSVVLPSTPQGVETGNDGRVLVAWSGPAWSPAFRRTRSRSSTARLPRTSSAAGQRAGPAHHSRAAAGPRLYGRPTTTFTGKLLRTPDGNFIVGVITPTNASTYIFVYEVARA